MNDDLFVVPIEKTKGFFGIIKRYVPSRQFGCADQGHC